ncbi:AAA domain-containing protein, partial [Lentinula aff. detonsa]
MNTSETSVKKSEMSGLRAVYIVGPSSAGKTTLCNALAARLRLPSSMHITEVARTVMKEQGFTRADVHSFAMQHAIVKAQVAKDWEARQNTTAENTTLGQPILLSDRSAVDAVVYAALSELTTKSGSTQAHFVFRFPRGLGFISFSTEYICIAATDKIMDGGRRSSKFRRWGALLCYVREGFEGAKYSVHEVGRKLPMVRRTGRDCETSNRFDV